MRPRPSEPATPLDAATIDLSGSCTGHSYLLVEPIGGGGTGRVWRAVDRSTGAQVAVKLLHRDLMSEPKAVTRFVQEREILLMLRHRNVVRVRDLLAIGDSLGLVMDLVGGGSLRQLLRRQGTLRPAEATGLLAQVADALAHAHGLSVVHRDLKPDNILVDAAEIEEPPAGGEAGDRSVPRVRLTDFGIARLLDEPGITTPHALVGTPNYLAPEVITGGSASAAVDVYALGITLYELLLGRPPYPGGPVMAVLRRHVECDLRRPPGVPDEVWPVILACTAKDPGQRPTAEQLAVTLQALAWRTADAPAAPPAPPMPAGPAPRHARAALVEGAGEAGPHGPSAMSGGRRREPAGTVRPPVPGLRVGAGRRRRRGRLRRWSRPLLLAAAAAAVLAAAGSGAVQWPGWLAGDGAGRVPQQQAAESPPVRAPAQLRTTTAAGAVAVRPTASATAQPTRRRETAKRTGSGHRGSQTEAYGPLRCTQEYVWDVGHPAVARPCHAEGPAVRLLGRLQALPGVRADVTLTLVDLSTGRAVGRPHTCYGLLFTDFSREQTCGPVEVRPRRGRRYVLVQRWSYSGRGMLPAGSARGTPFTW